MLTCQKLIKKKILDSSRHNIHKQPKQQGKNPFPAKGSQTQALHPTALPRALLGTAALRKTIPMAQGWWEEERWESSPPSGAHTPQETAAPWSLTPNTEVIPE